MSAVIELQSVVREPLRKRIFDVVVGLPIAVLLSPVIVGLAIGSLICFRSNPFFVQTRIGRSGRPYSFVKIRSLPNSTPKYLAKNGLHVIEIGKWGKLIRRHHMDEFPQVWHVVTGHMSLVGPRPEMPGLDADLSANHRLARHSVRPGCTGLWQISTRSAGMIKDAPEFDIFYLDNWSLRLDAWILWRTLRELVGAPPISSLESVPNWAVGRNAH